MGRKPDSRRVLPALTLAFCLLAIPASSQLKSVVYDFDGFDIGATDLPEGDYKYGDLSYQVSANPLPAAEMLGDRVLKMDIAWNANYGAFGRGISRFLETDPSHDVLNFYFYNPVANQQAAELEITIGDDDNQSLQYETASDDTWKKSLSIAAGPSWQLISIPLSAFSDANAGGNSVFDIGWSQAKGMLLLVEFRFSKPLGAGSSATYFIDMICFSDGALPTGANNLSLPPKSATDYCRVGAHQYEAPGYFWQIPQHFEGMFPAVAGRKLKYVNTYIHWADGSTTTPQNYPGSGYQTLIDNGYTPIITWEPQFAGYSPQDAAQPHYTNIINGDYDSYIDAFAGKVKSYSDTIIIRLMHEFDGDWYPWCISQNGQDPQKFVSTYRHIVDRFNTQGAKNVKWMWCPNSDPVPHQPWNWIISAYPGDNYVDIVGTDVYNAHYPASLPWWRSFRWLTAEVYYYFRKHIPSRPVVICELACRERFASEPAASETKAQWWAAMDRELQSEFCKVRGIVFFSETKDQTWAVNTSQASVNSLRDNIWYDDYYFSTATALDRLTVGEIRLYPNPASETVHINEIAGPTTFTVIDMAGRALMISRNAGKTFDISTLPEGQYLVVFSEFNNNFIVPKKLVVKRTP